MRKRSFITAVVAGIGLIFVSASIYAGTSVPDVVKMDNKAYEKHKKAIVLFSHKKHAETYTTANPDLFKSGCGECHHDADGKPLVLKAGDAVQGCIECHKIPGERPKGSNAPKLNKKERLQYHAEALHYNCRDCHKKFKKKTKTKKAPTTCTKCHAKKK